MPRRPAVHVATITRATIAIGTVLLAASCGRGGDGGDAAGSFPETREPFEPTAEMRMTAVATCYWRPCSPSSCFAAGYRFQFVIR